MATAPAHNTASRPDSWPMYRALVGVGMLCALLIVSVFVLTLPVIARNEASALQQAVFKVLPGASAKTSFFLGADNSFRPAQAGDSPQQLVHVGYNGEGELVGVAIQAQGMGYQDTIRVLYGYSPASQTIVGMQVLASKETPGLGDKIEKDAAFIDNFRALDVSLGADGESLQHLIEAVKSGAKTSPWQIDGITGATISSKAIAGILRQSSQQWVPLIHRQREALSQPQGQPGGDHGEQ
jgi:H+/Na+-translocating ferredoxin:NAD+ oxidoreductase subunit G